MTQTQDSAGIPAAAPAASGRTLDEELTRSALRAPDDPALWAPGQGELTFARWAEAVAAGAKELADLHVAAGRRIALKFDGADVLGLAVAQLAVQTLRASALVLPPDVSTAAQESALHTTHAGLLMRSGSRWDKPVVEPLHAARLAADATDAPGDEALIVLTSGSTGEPKPVPITHAELTFSLAAGLGHENKAPRDKSIAHSFVAGTNAFHDYLSRAVLGQLYVHVVPGADPAQLWQVATERAVPRFGLSPVAARRFVDWVRGNGYDGSSIERVGLTGAAIDPELVRRLRETFPHAQEQIATRRRSSKALRGYFRDLIRRRREEPGHDLVTRLLDTERDGDRMDDSDVVASCVLLLVAGHTTTANFIANSALALLRQPDQLATLLSMPPSTTTWVEELLRYEAPIQMMSRVAVREFTFESRSFHPGDQVIVVLGSANRDPAAFEHPDELNLLRASGRHLSLGMGIHSCLGAQLARLEGEVAIRALARHLVRARFDPADVRWRRDMVHRGPIRLPIKLDSTSTMTNIDTPIARREHAERCSPRADRVLHFSS